MITDIHSHIKRDDGAQEKLEKALLEDMDKNNIAVRVVSSLEGKPITEQNNYISDFVNRHSDRLVGCAIINPREAGSVEEAWRALNLPGMRLLELNSFEHGYYPELCGNIEGVLEAAENKNAPVKLFTGIGARAIPQQWLGYIKRHPKVKFIFLHMGCFDYGYGCVDLAEEYGNIYLETSNQYEVQILKKAFSKLPKEKIVFGSSYPERLTKCSIDVFEMFHLEKEYLDNIYFKTAENILGN